MKQFEKIITTRQFSSFKALAKDGTIKSSPVFEDGFEVKGKRWIYFTPYIHPAKTVDENFQVLQAQSKVIQTVFPSYDPPSKAMIQSVISGRKAMHKGIMKAGAIAEKSLPSPWERMIG